MTTHPLANQRANFRHLYGDIFWYGILAGSSIAFINIYAARLGASALQIGLLTAGPAIVNLLFSVPAGNWLHDRSLVKTSFWSALYQRLGFAALICLPVLASATLEIRVMILTTLVMSLPGTLLAISFYAMFAELVPPDQRALVDRKSVV